MRVNLLVCHNLHIHFSSKIFPHNIFFKNHTLINSYRILITQNLSIKKYQKKKKKKTFKIQKKLMYSIFSHLFFRKNPVDKFKSKF